VAALGLAVDQSITDIALYWVVQNIILGQNSDRNTRFSKKWITACAGNGPVVNSETCGVKAELYNLFQNVHASKGARSDVVVKALHYKLAGLGFDSRWCHWNFSMT
jgi:hypothetical protein